MIPWWGLVIAFIMGGLFSAVIVMVCAAGESEAEQRWKDEQRGNH